MATHTTPPRLRWIGYGIAALIVVWGLAFVVGYVADYLGSDHVDPLQRAVELVRGCVIGALVDWIGILALVRTVSLDRADSAHDSVDAAVAPRPRRVYAMVCVLCVVAGAMEVAVLLVWATGDHHAVDGRGWFDHLGTVLMAGVAAGILLRLHRPPTALSVYSPDSLGQARRYIQN